MGMESFNIMMLPENVSIVRDNEWWNLQGTAQVKVNIIRNQLSNICNIDNGNNEYIYNDCIDIKVYDNEQCFQGFELRGCLSYLEKGIEYCFNFYEYWKDKIPLKIYILNKPIDVQDSKDLYKIICDMYSEKINIFRKQYGNIEIKVTSGKFYNEIKKRSKWYYKLFLLFKG